MKAIEFIKKILSDSLIGIYLYGSYTMGGLKQDSDIDILVVINKSLSFSIREQLTNELMTISGKVGNQKIRPLEITVVNINEIRPFSYPPRYEYMYGEWLREEMENGEIPDAIYDSDLIIILAQAGEYGKTIEGTPLKELIQPIENKFIRNAILDSLQSLTENLRGDERNVILTLARMWYTIETNQFTTKDKAAFWAKQRLNNEQANLVDIAMRSYTGQYKDEWEDLESEVEILITEMKDKIQG